MNTDITKYIQPCKDGRFAADAAEQARAAAKKFATNVNHVGVLVRFAAHGTNNDGVNVGILDYVPLIVVVEM